ncbi:MAG: hypothetical protein M0P72_07335 [Metallibacterium scheffleri]|uniref:hypothetical protein n=1 Tax=Metallibacterium scheffleri TaxID=993689 RepID=UPI0026EA4A03|nr:hypothetical protein [Metallibacterium scheffleri]MCK9366942.1 hypothetical protein [Metallibacterium scheffleri]
MGTQPLLLCPQAGNQLLVIFHQCAVALIQGLILAILCMRPRRDLLMLSLQFTQLRASGLQFVIEFLRPTYGFVDTTLCAILGLAETGAFDLQVLGFRIGKRLAHDMRKCRIRCICQSFEIQFRSAQNFAQPGAPELRQRKSTNRTGTRRTQKSINAPNGLLAPIHSQGECRFESLHFGSPILQQV